MEESSLQRSHFETDAPSLAATAACVLAPALSSSGALSRFEFEAGRGNEGTKILMVEWKDNDESLANPASWEVSWKGKNTVISQQGVVAGEATTHRFYFLLPPGATIPRIVKIAKAGG